MEKNKFNLTDRLVRVDRSSDNHKRFLFQEWIYQMREDLPLINDIPKKARASQMVRCWQKAIY
jgi:hypothetical protein